MHPIPFNEAEAIIELFWDPAQSELAQWTIDPGRTTGLAVRQDWCLVKFEWTAGPDAGPALRMHRECDVACADYDGLVLSVMAPTGSHVRLIAETDRGTLSTQAPPAGRRKSEIVLDLAGAARITGLAIEIDAAEDGPALGWLNWLGLQASDRLEHVLARHDCWDARWEKHLLPDTFDPTFSPSYGLLLGKDELAALRSRHGEAIASDADHPLHEAVRAARRNEPEDLIGDYVNFWDDTRYCRVRDHDRRILDHGINAAIAGHLLQDKGLLRLAARYALSIGMCEHWDDGFVCCLPGGTFGHRCFVQSLCAYEIAGILDLAGECFTDLGREFLLRRLAEVAIGSIQYNTWRFDYIFHCNQLAWFTPGRMLALGVLHRNWPRVRPYLDIAHGELCESLELTVGPDGGYVEGPSYFRCVGRDAGLGIYHYCRAVGEPMDARVPETLRRCGDFGEAIISTDDQADVASICDSGNRLEIITQAMMARLLPDSAWRSMVDRAVARTGPWRGPRMSDSAIAAGALEHLPPAQPRLRPLVVLPEMGPVASHRRLGDHHVKLFIQGNKAGAGHTHEDKGSFILEFAGQTFAVDPGTCDYGHPLSNELQHCQRHNMLVPFGFAERPHPECPLPQDVKPIASGDETTFHAEIDATPGWGPYFRKWQRTWDSPRPDVLVVTDDYELQTGEGVEFHWQTLLPVELAGRRASILGRAGRVELQAPEGLRWRLDELPLLEGVQLRLALRQERPAGTLTVTARLHFG
jgi:hypothetical protein